MNELRSLISLENEDESARKKIFSFLLFLLLLLPMTVFCERVCVCCSFSFRFPAAAPNVAELWQTHSHPLTRPAARWELEKSLSHSLTRFHIF